MSIPKPRFFNKKLHKKWDLPGSKICLIFLLTKVLGVWYNKITRASAGARGAKGKIRKIGLIDPGKKIAESSSPLRLVIIVFTFPLTVPWPVASLTSWQFFIGVRLPQHWPPPLPLFILSPWWGVLAILFAKGHSQLRLAWKWGSRTLEPFFLNSVLSIAFFVLFVNPQILLRVV